jgi:hypothetical protein
MKIETKYEIGQNVYYLCANCIQLAKVMSIRTDNYREETRKTKIRYTVYVGTSTFSGPVEREEDDLFADVESAREHWASLLREDIKTIMSHSKTKFTHLIGKEIDG